MDDSQRPTDTENAPGGKTDHLRTDCDNLGRFGESIVGVEIEVDDRRKEWRWVHEHRGELMGDSPPHAASGVVLNSKA